MTLMVMHDGQAEQLEELDQDDCLRLLATRGVGRVAVVVDGFPVVLPVNYRTLDGDDGLRVVMRTRAGSALDASSRAGFEVDGIDAAHREGWSVLIRGELAHLAPEEIAAYGSAADPGPWVDDRDSWLVLRAHDVSGRLLHAPRVEWQLTLRAYL